MLSLRAPKGRGNPPNRTKKVWNHPHLFLSFIETDTSKQLEKMIP